MKKPSPINKPKREPVRFIGCEIDAALYRKIELAALKEQRSISFVVRRSLAETHP